MANTFIRRTYSVTRQRGFTLTELFAVVAIGAILAALAIPSMEKFILDNARTARVNTLVLALNLARSEAIARRSNITLCRVVMPTPTCNAGGGAGDQWEDGYAVRWDQNADGDITDNLDLRRAFDPDFPDNASFRATDGVNDIAQVVYGPTGRLINPPNTLIRFVHCDKRGAEEARAVVLSFSGQPRISTDDADADSIHDVDGANVTCP